MSQGELATEEDIDDAFLENMMAPDVDVQGNEAHREAVVGTLPVLNNIWECPMLSKTVTVDNTSGRSYAGWSCGWCIKEGDDLPFQGANASKAPWHVLKEAGHDIRTCRGYISQNKLAQYQHGELKS
jgi:hypothetical protein